LSGLALFRDAVFISLQTKPGNMKSAKPANINEYIAGYPPPVQAILQEMRETIQAAAPDAGEAISYGIPTFKLNGNLVHFAAFQNHIGFYATPTGHEAFEKELSVYKQGKGSVQFPLGEPLPLPLIRKIVKFRVKQNTERADAKKK
jgi:uncharacterized protein YdhG (YjbR/CyaY superfamily)